MKTHWQLRMALVLVAALCLPAPLDAQIVHDTTLGTACGAVVGTPAGGGFTFGIRPECGVQRGGNLFQSFSQFGINAGDAAVFSGPKGVKNILARVTGGSESQINGTLQVDVTGANLFLINPWGILFGQGAHLNVNGSFTATTASYVKLADGGKFNAVNPGQSSLSMADPVRFGFLGSSPGQITVDSVQLSGAQKLALVGGDITLRKAAGLIPGLGGDISLTSVKSAGEFAESPDPSAFSKGGTITLSGGSSVGAVGQSSFNAGGGRIVIRGGELMMDGASTIQHNTHPNSATTDYLGGIDIALKGLLALLSGSSIISINESGSLDQATSEPLTKGGPISIRAQEVKVGGAADQSSSVIASRAFSGRDAGDVAIEADTVEINQRGIVANVSAVAPGAPPPGRNSGKTLIKAGNIVLNGPGGSLQLSTEQFPIATGSIVSDNAGTQFNPDAPNNIGPPGGDVEIRAGSLVLNRAAIINGSAGIGNGGNILIAAHDITVNHGNIDNSSSGTGNAGDIRISADSLAVNELASPNAEGPVSGISAATSGDQGGNVNIQTGSLTVDGAFITASRFTPIQPPGGLFGFVPPAPSPGQNAANITIDASKSVKLVNARIDSANSGANPNAGGNVNFTAGGSIMVQDSTINASGGAGGGNVLFKAPMVSILDTILSAAAPLPDGLVGIETCVLDFQRNALAAAAGLQADVMICDTPPGNWPSRPPHFGGWPEPVLPDSPGLPPPVSIPDLMKQTPLAPECGVRLDISSFIRRGRGGVALEPGGWQPGLSMPQVSPEKK